MAEWLETLNDDLKTNESLAQFEDVNGLAGAYVETKKMVGNSLRVPSPEAGEEDMAKFYQTLIERVPNLTLKPDAEDQSAVNKFWGVPDDADGYEVPEDMDATSAQKSREMAAQLGLNQKQYNKALAYFEKEGEALTEQQQQASAEAEQQLDAKLGAAKEQARSIVDNLALKFQDADVPVEEWSPGQLLMLNNMAKALNSDPQAFAQPNAPQVIPDRNEALEQIAEIDNKLTGNRNELGPQEYNRLMAKKATLLQQAHG
jgi:hypothetical protein